MSVFGVFGEFDSDNIGDILIGEGAFILLSEQLVDVRKLPLGRVSSLTNTMNKTKNKKNNVKIFHRYLYSRYISYRHIIEISKLPSELKLLNKYAIDNVSDLDVIIIGGGQLLHDNTLRMLIRILFIINEANKKQKPVVFFGTGASAPRTVFSKFLFKKIFKELDSSKIYLRDNRSTEIVAKFFPVSNANIVLIPDTAIARACQKTINKKSVEKIWGLAPISKDTLPFELRKEKINQDEWWMCMAESLIKNNITPVLFSSGVMSDHERCLSIQSKLKIENNIELDVLPRPKDTDTFLKQLSHLDKVIAQRLHISISYFSMGGSPYSLPWDKKVFEFYNIIGMPERHSDCLDVDKVIKDVLKAPNPSISIEDLYRKLTLCVSCIANISIHEGRLQ
jgi:polysaccharide pyruvyl transferase WcaK-like protein